MTGMINDFRERLFKQNRNVLIVVTGLPGSGKSYAALKIAELASNPGRFTIRNVVFSGEEFMTLLNSGTLEKGDWVVFDEAGVSLSARQWNSLTNKLLNFVLQTFRHRNIGVIFCAPDYTFVDSATRKLFHAYIETNEKKINREMGYNDIKYFNLEPEPRFKKTYYKFQRRNTPRGSVVLAITRVHLPSTELLEAYEPRKERFTTELNKDIFEDFMIIKGQRQEQLKEVRINPEEIMAKVLLSPKEYGLTVTKKGLKKIDAEFIAAKFGVGGRYGQRAKKLIEQKLNAPEGGLNGG